MVPDPMDVEIKDVDLEDVSSGSGRQTQLADDPVSDVSKSMRGRYPAAAGLHPDRWKLRSNEHIGYVGSAALHPTKPKG